MRRTLVAALVLLACAVWAQPIARAAEKGAQVPSQVAAWFDEDGIDVVRDVLTEPGSSASPDIVLSPAVPEYDLVTPRYDLAAGKVVKGPTTLTGAIRDSGKYCALGIASDSGAAGTVCVEVDSAGKVTPVGAFGRTMLPGVTELPTSGFVDVAPDVGLFGVDVAADRVTALDASAKASLPYGEAEGSAFVVAVGKHVTELAALQKAGGDGEGAAGDAASTVLDVAEASPSGVGPAPVTAAAGGATSSWSGWWVVGGAGCVLLVGLTALVKVRRRAGTAG